MIAYRRWRGRNDLSHLWGYTIKVLGAIFTRYPERKSWSISAGQLHVDTCERRPKEDTGGEKLGGPGRKQIGPFYVVWREL